MVDFGGARRVGDGLMNCMQHLFKMCESLEWLSQTTAKAFVFFIMRSVLGKH